jgi:alpha-L-rhamnosidase
MTDLVATELRVEHAPNPLGTDVPRPRFSWVPRTEQTAYQIVVASDPALLPDRPDVWDSGVVRTDRSFDIRYAGPPLSSRTRYWWTVRLSESSDWAPVSWWETALDQADWTARWIGNAPSDSVLPLRYAERDIPAVLAPDHSLGQSFRADRPIDSISVCLMTWGERDRHCTATLHRDGPDGEIVAREEVTRTGDFFSWWLAPQPALPPGPYYLELSGANGDIGWWTAQHGAIPGGQAYADGEPVPGLRTLAVEPVPPPEPLLRKDFSLPAGIAQARLYATGLGYHELFLNGQRVGDAVLDPPITDYQTRVLYSCHDVTGLLRAGGNTVAATLGRGFYGMRQASVWGWNCAVWNADPRLLCQLEITLESGEKHTIGTDESWRITDGPTIADTSYGGETYDARLARTGWTEPGYDDSSWASAATVAAPLGTLRVAALPPTTIVGEFAVESTNELPDGSTVHDFGRVTSGWPTVTTTGAAGTELVLRYGEKLRDDGSVDHENWHAVGDAQTDRYILAGTVPSGSAPQAPLRTANEQWRPRFSYKGFRYVQTSGAKASVTAHPVHTNVEDAGDFHCSDDLLNWIEEATRTTVLNNLQGIPTDTPLYEKNGWTADAHLIAETAIHDFDMHRFFAKWLDDIRDAQLPDGGIPVIVPTPGWGTFTDPAWSDAYPLLAWNLYEYYGDADVLAEHYEPLRRYTEMLRTTCRAADWLWPLFSHGDWLAPGYSLAPEGPKLAGTAYAYLAARRMTQIAETLGQAGDAERYAEFARDVSQAFDKTFLDRDNAIYKTDIETEYRQASNVLPLAFGLVPDDFVEPVVANLVRDIVDVHDGHLNVGALGVKHLLPVLSRHGRADLALTVALQRTYPSWGQWREKGATSMWEAWDLDARSHDHYFLGTVSQWLHEDVAGLRPAAPGFAEIEVRPRCIGDPRLTHASARYQSIRGEIAVSWATGGDIEVTVPFGARAHVHTPAGVETVGAGTHRVQLRPQL